MKLWNAIIRTGVSLTKDRLQNRHIILCNRISSILSMATLIIFVVASLYFGLILSVKLAFLTSIIFLTPILLNKTGFYNASRIFLSLSICLIAISLSVADKFDVPGLLEEFQYFQFRLILLISCLFPFILFKLEERTYWISLIVINFAIIVLFDPIHELFGVGYYQVGFSAPNYYFLNYMVIITFIILAGSTYSLKFSFEKYEQRNELLILDLHEANNLILKQRELLTQENKQLNHELVETNKQLTETNRELIQHNNDLLQFSYTVSHNLRGPVASLIGLMHLLQKENLTEEEGRIILHINKSLTSLNNIILDLSSIIDIRNAVVQVKQMVILSDEVESIRSLLIKQIHDQHVTIETDFAEVPSIISVKAMINSILYNLISNAIKYRSPDRHPKIKIVSSHIGNYIRIDVSDNGLGIDLGKFKENLFGLYKRFHTHTEGKGLGLFLVKLQSEVLGGYVEVDSTQGIGTRFSIYLNKIIPNEEQILLDSPLVTIIFNAGKNYMLSQWKRSVSMEEFKGVSIHIAEFIKNYRIPNWIVDLTRSQNNEQGVSEFRREFHHSLQTYGTRQIAFVIPRSTVPKSEYDDRVALILDSYTLPVAVFESIDDASNWINRETD